MALRSDSNKFSGKYASTRVALRRTADGTRLRVHLFTKGSRQVAYSYDEKHWAATKDEALKAAQWLYDGAWGHSIPKK